MAPNPKQLYGDKKPPLGQMPLTAIIHGALAFYDGKGKYGDRNWRKNPVQAQTYVEAILRHVLLWANGEELARDTGVHNLGGVIASASLLLDAQVNGVLLDNRVKSQAACDLLHEAEKVVASLNEQHRIRRETLDAEAAKLEQAQVDEYDTEVDIEENKRAQATDAVAVLMRLQDDWWEGTGDQQKALEPRIRGAQDVILNMVNGTFPYPTTGEYRRKVALDGETQELTPEGWRPLQVDPPGDDSIVDPAVLDRAADAAEGIGLYIDEDRSGEVDVGSAPRLQDHPAMRFRP